MLDLCHGEGIKLHQKVEAMKQSFKDAAKKYLKSSTLTFALAAAGLAYGGSKAYEYYSPSPHKTAYAECVEQQKACTAEQMALVKHHATLSTQATVWLILPQMWLLMGLGYRKDEKHREKIRELNVEYVEQTEKYYNEMDRRLELSGKLEQAEAKLAPFLADEKRKTDTAAEAAAKQQLNQMAQDATTLQGQIKVGKKISIKQTPPTTPQQP
jgi:hypothetical protein